MSAKASSQFDYSEYSRKMRLALSNEDIKNPGDGSLNHKYFLVKKGSYWSELNQKNLIKGLGLYGVGKWDKIKATLLTDFTEVEIELRACLLLGVNNLKDYQDQKLGSEQIEEERENNLKEGAERNKLKNNIYMKYSESQF